MDIQKTKKRRTGSGVRKPRDKDANHNNSINARIRVIPERNPQVSSAEYFLLPAITMQSPASIAAEINDVPNRQQRKLNRRRVFSIL
jgi:hypothetical protein